MSPTEFFRYVNMWSYPEKKKCPAYLISGQAIKVGEKLLSGMYNGFLLYCQLLEVDLKK